MQIISLPNYANARFKVRTDDNIWTVTLRSLKGITLVTIADKDGVICYSTRAVVGQWLIPYKHLSQNGNFRFETDSSEEYPTYKNYGSFRFVYYTNDEVNEIGW